MPNWCQNILLVHGSAEERECFRRFARGHELFADGCVEQLELCFDNFVPVPGEIRDRPHVRPANTPADPSEAAVVAELVERHGADNWYDFRVDKWGTKWEPRDVVVTEEGSELAYAFNTAWSPPCRIVLAAAERFPALWFALSYSEMGLGFRGDFACRGGVLVQDVYETYDPFDELARVPGPLVECDLGDAPRDIRFKPRDGNRLFISDGYISDSVVLVPIARLTNPQKSIARLVSRGNAAYQAASTRGTRLGWRQMPDLVDLAGVVTEAENAEPTEAIALVELMHADASSRLNHGRPIQLLELTPWVGETLVCEAALLAPLIAMAGDGVQVSVRGARFVLVKDAAGEFVGVAGLWVCDCPPTPSPSDGE